MMIKEEISKIQAISVMTSFLIGSAVIFSPSIQAKQYAWIAAILASLASIPIMYVYAQLTMLYQGKDIYDISEIVLGRKAGTIVNLLFIWYAFHLGSLVIRNFTEFIQIISLAETPLYIIAISMGLFCIWVVKKGIEVLGRWAAFVTPIIILVSLLTTALAIPMMDINNIRPVNFNGLKPVLSTSAILFTFPLGETVLFTAVLSNLRNKKEAFNIYLISITISMTFLIISVMRNILVLGKFAYITNFPSFVAISLIDIAHFLERIEIIIAVNFTLAGIVKISICLYAACKGLAKVFRLEDYKPIAAPIGLLMINLSLIIYRNFMEMWDWALKVYPYYAIPFQVIIPITLFIGALIKLKLKSSSTM